MKQLQQLSPESRVLWVKLGTVLLATLLYIFVFLFLFRNVGPEIALIAVLPVVTAGWLFNRQVGLLAGVLSVILNWGLFKMAGVSYLEGLSYLSGPGSIILVIIGGIMGRSRELFDRVRDQRQTLEREIAERKQAEEALQRAKDEAEAANLAKSEFVSFVSHELRAPISAIKLSKEILSKAGMGSINGTQLKLLETINVSADRMMHLVSELTDVSRIETGQLLLQHAPVCLSEVLQDVSTSFQAQFEQKNQILSLQVPENLPLLWCDRARLIQVMTNLISNAHKYTPMGGEITIFAELSADKSASNGSGEYVRIAVQDNGIGISREDQEKVFQKFFRVEGEQARIVPGTGLGLTITKNLVELQNGRIWFESEFRQGTTFHFTLPTLKNGSPPPSNS